MRKIKIDPTAKNIMAFSVCLLPVIIGAIIVFGGLVAIVKGLM